MPTSELPYRIVSQYDMDAKCPLCTNKYIDIWLEPCGCRTHSHCILYITPLQYINKCRISDKDVTKIWKREDRIGRKWFPIN